MQKLFRKGILISTIALSLLAVSCGGKKEAAKVDLGEDKGDYPINISVFTVQPLQQPPADNKIFKWIEEKFKVTFTWDIAVAQKDQKIGVMIASGDYPDLIELDGKKFIEAGAVIPLEDLIDQYGPNLKKHYASAWEKMKSDDGHIYCLPNWGVLDGRDQSTWYGDSAMWVQKAVLKEFGYPKITTVDEYFDLLAKYKERYPTINGMPTIAYTILTYDWRAFCLINPPNFLAGYPNDGNGTVDPKTHKYQVFLYQDISKRWFKKLNELNAKGLIDRSCFVDNYDQYLAKLSSGRVLGFHDQAWQFQNASTSLTNQEMFERTWAPLPIVFDSSITPRYRNRPLPNITTGFGISVKAKDPIRLIRFMDQQLAEENQRVLHWGIEGEDWQYDENKVPYRTEEQRKQQEDQVWKLKNKADIWYSTAPKMRGSFSDGYSCELAELPGEMLATQRPADVELWKAYGVASYAELMDKDPPENSVWFPMWQITPDDGSDAQIAWKRCEELYRKYLPRIILGKPDQFEDLWTEYVSALKDAGVAKYEAYMQSKLDERIKKWSPKN
jgi:putative aldouronate transport system substrate-binding protein